VTVKFNSDEILSVQGNEIVVSISAAPERGKANAELIKKLAKHFKVDSGNVRIVSGRTSRKKTVQIS
jgi:uncharacterized protein (TIGR00251 family)